LAEDAEVKEGTVLNLSVSDGKVVATPVRRGKLSLTQLLAKVNRKNLHAEVEFGSPIGRDLVIALDGTFQPVVMYSTISSSQR